MKPSPEQRRTMLILGGAFILSILIHLVFLTALRNYHEPRTEERQEIQQVTLTTVVHLHTPTPPPIPTPTPPEPSPTPPPTPTPEPTVTPPPNTPKPATPKPQTPAPVKPKPIAHPQAAPKAAHLHLNVPKTNTVRTDAQTESHADTAPGTQNGTLSGHGITGGAPGTGPGGPGTGAVPAAPEEPVASCPHPNRLAGVDDPVEPEAPEGTEGISGIVRVEVTLTADGQIVDVKVGQSSGNPLLDKAALDASRRSKFHSIRKNCVDVPGTYLYRVEFAGS